MAKNHSGLPGAVKGHGKAIRKVSRIPAVLTRAASGDWKGGQVLPGVHVRR